MVSIKKIMMDTEAITMPLILASKKALHSIKPIMDRISPTTVAAIPKKTIVISFY